MLAGLVGRRGIEVLAHRHVAELARHLKGAHHARAGALRGAGAVERRARRAGCGPTIGVRNPEITLNSVDLPAPFGPIRPVMPSSGTLSAMSFRISTPPRDAEILLISSVIAW